MHFPLQLVMDVTRHSQDPPESAFYIFGYVQRPPSFSISRMILTGDYSRALGRACVSLTFAAGILRLSLAGHFSRHLGSSRYDGSSTREKRRGSFIIKNLQEREKETQKDSSLRTSHGCLWRVTRMNVIRSQEQNIDANKKRAGMGKRDRRILSTSLAFSRVAVTVAFSSLT